MINKLSVVVPCFNEEGNVYLFKKEIIEFFRGFPFDSEFIFVDDGSTDKTNSLLDSLRGNDPKIKILTHSKNKGLGQSVRDGIDSSTGDAILTLDADLTFHPREFAELLEAYKPDVDCVSGSPFMGGFMGVSFFRRFLSVSVNRIYKVLLGQKITATSSLLRLYKANAVQSLELTSTSFDINAEIISKLVFSGNKIVEVPVVLTERIFGVSKIKITREIKNHLKMFLKIMIWRAAGIKNKLA